MHTQTGPRGPGVSVTALDELVKEYLEAQHGESPPDAQARADTWAARDLLERGRVGEAADLIQRAAPAILEDQRLLFRLERQQFIELLRQGTNDGDARAIECARQQLAPLALHAYPEAFTDFKSAMLMLVQAQPQPRRRIGRRDRAAAAAAEAEAAAGGGAALNAGEGGAAASSGDEGTDGSQGSGGSDGEEEEEEEVALRFETSDGRAHADEDAAIAHCSSHPGVWIARRLTGQAAARAAAAARRSGLMGEARAARSKAARRELSEIVFHTMRQHFGWLDPRLPLLLRYLLLVNTAHSETAPQSAGLPEAERALADELLERDAEGLLRDAAPLQSEASGLSFPETDLLALMQGARLSRAAAWDALKRARGDADAALRDELMRVRLDDGVLLPLAEEYAAYRGLGGGGGEEDGEGDAGLEGGGGEAEGRGDMEVDGEGPPPPQQQQQQREGRGGGAAAAAGSGPPGEGARLQQRLGGAGWPRCDSRSPPYKVPRWGAAQSATGFSEGGSDGAAAAGAAAGAGAGAAEEPPPPSADGGAAPPLPPPAAVAAAAVEKRARAAAAALRERHAPLLQLQALARAGEWADAEALVERHAPGALRVERPELLFDLQRARFSRLVARGDVAGALALARADMTPLADAHPALVPALKAAMAGLLPGGGAGGSGASGAPDESALGAALQEALADALGLQGPRLVALLRGLLAVHKSWFRMQRCSDPFASALGLARLRADADRAAATAGPSPVDGAPGGAGSGGAGGGGGGGGPAAARAQAAAAAAAAGGAAAAAALGMPGLAPETGSEDDGGDDLDEASVLRLMEVLEIPRGLAIELLIQHRGSVEDAVMQVVAG
ncbi:hypothetical protein Rsub_05830 [Raphidocelis subcapitata]|uniref:CTLH domain-containing protein n=1 Tax=Raphidocelis subcapitata TaxID=307507 RepID=A0A2V0NZD9_9CHLO|nr:hypothetical protein Rsub_05830 [Raphidocelis subcapitata]|eukprot:GBF92994.1 hypothetical protein Rsub_05830 [Raphidocelis subcapitata]